jgi:hypothetical protein
VLGAWDSVFRYGTFKGGASRVSRFGRCGAVAYSSCIGAAISPLLERSATRQHQPTDENNGYHQGVVQCSWSVPRDSGLVVYVNLRMEWEQKYHIRKARTRFAYDGDRRVHVFGVWDLWFAVRYCVAACSSALAGAFRDSAFAISVPPERSATRRH